MKVKVTCKNCGLIFEKSNSEVKRSEKFNRNHFCSRVCVGTYSSNWYNPNKKYYEISKHCFNRNDEYTKFRYHFRNIKKRDKEVGVTIEYLKKIWEEQNGVCPFTGINLTLNTFKNRENNVLFSASLDRIDSSKGCIEGNVRWVSRGINLMKSNNSDDIVWEMCKMIYENYKKINHSK